MKERLNGVLERVTDKLNEWSGASDEIDFTAWYVRTSTPHDDIGTRHERKNVADYFDNELLTALKGLEEKMKTPDGADGNPAR
jgi:hypothetical protein